METGVCGGEYRNRTSVHGFVKLGMHQIYVIFFRETAQYARRLHEQCLSEARQTGLSLTNDSQLMGEFPVSFTEGTMVTYSQSIKFVP